MRGRRESLGEEGRIYRRGTEYAEERREEEIRLDTGPRRTETSAEKRSGDADGRAGRKMAGAPT